MDAANKDFDGAGARSDASDQEAWDVAIEANELVGTDLPGALALFDRAIKLSARSGAADPGLQQLWAEVAIEVGVPDAQTRQVIDSVIATTPDDDPGAMAYARNVGPPRAPGPQFLSGTDADDPRRRPPRHSRSA